MMGDRVGIFAQLVVVETFERPGHCGMQLDAAGAQLHGVGNLLDQRMAEGEAFLPGLAGHILNQFNFQQAAEDRREVGRGARVTSASTGSGNSRPIVAPTCRTSLSVGASRSMRAQITV